jgi:hypothetical protein
LPLCSLPPLRLFFIILIENEIVYDLTAII